MPQHADSRTLICSHCGDTHLIDNAPGTRLLPCGALYNDGRDPLAPYRQQRDRAMTDWERAMVAAENLVVRVFCPWLAVYRLWRHPL